MNKKAKVKTALLRLACIPIRMATAVLRGCVWVMVVGSTRSNLK